jgi:hypothetical protein
MGSILRLEPPASPSEDAQSGAASDRFEGAPVVGHALGIACDISDSRRGMRRWHRQLRQVGRDPSPTLDATIDRRRTSDVPGISLLQTCVQTTLRRWRPAPRGPRRLPQLI